MKQQCAQFVAKEGCAQLTEKLFPFDFLLIMFLMGKVYYRMSCLIAGSDHSLGHSGGASCIITPEVNLQKSKRSVDHPRNKPRMSFRGISDTTTILYPFGAENRAKSSLLKPTTVVAGTTISAVKKNAPHKCSMLRHNRRILQRTFQA